MKRHSRGFTLIELLIVIAILAIISATTMGLLIGPLREQAKAESLAAMEADANRAFLHLTQDIHSATAFSSEKNGYLLTLPAGKVAHWFLEDGALRRRLTEAGAEPPGHTPQVAENVTAFLLEPAEEGRAIRLTLRCEVEVVQVRQRSERVATLTLGNPFREVTP